MSEYTRNVRATFNPTRYLSRATVLTFLITYTWIHSLYTRDPASIVYAGLITMGVLVALTHPATKELTISGTRLRGDADDPGFAWQFVWLPAMLVVFALILSFTKYPIRGTDWLEVVRLATFHVLIVASVETFLGAWLWPQVLPFGPATAALLGAGLHTDKIAAEPSFFFVALFMFLLFWTFLYLREVVHTKARRYFGFVAAMVVHGTANALALVFRITVGPLELAPFEWGLAGSLVAICVVAVVLVRGRRVGVWSS